jgi:hypothetical protein
MQWEKPEACEIGSYANAKLSVSPAPEQAEAVFAAEG